MKYSSLQLFFALLIILSSSSCSKYDPIYGTAEGEPPQPPSSKWTLVYIHDNDIYLANSLFTKTKRLTYSSTSPKTHCVLTDNRNKIAYLNQNNTPIIIDTSGAVLNTLTQYTGAKDINWYNNDATLYILYNNKINFYGQSLNISSDPFDYVFPSDVIASYIDAVHIDNNLNVAFSYRYREPYSQTSSYERYYYGAGVKYYSSSSWDEQLSNYDAFYDPTTYNYQTRNYEYYHSVRFNPIDNTLILGRTVNLTTSFYLRAWYYPSSTSTSSVSNSPLTYAKQFQANNTGTIASDEIFIKKTFNIAPQGSSNNTFLLDMGNSNNSIVTYFDWKP